MSFTQLAVIYLRPPPSGFRLLFEKDIAGLPLIKRLVLTLGRAGIDEVLLIAKGLEPDALKGLVLDLREDARFRGNVTGCDHGELLQKGLDSVPLLANEPGFLLVEGNVVTTAPSVKLFLRQSYLENPTDPAPVYATPHNPDTEARLHLIAPGRLDILERILKGEVIDEPVESVLWDEDDERFYLTAVDNLESAQAAEAGLLRQNRLGYTQLLDRWVNARFSTRISSRLIKTPLTPNQITLLGLLIGLCAGWFFSWGNYLGGLLGGILMAGTAVWDCCDGDVARLKFMESDFGESLDTFCDNLINVFAFTGMMIGMARTEGFAQAMIPFGLLAAGGVSIFAMIYATPQGKGALFAGTALAPVIELLASRNFIYVVLIFALFGRIDAFLWMAGLGSVLFALVLYFFKRKIHRRPPETPPA